MNSRVKYVLIMIGLLVLWLILNRVTIKQNIVFHQHIENNKEIKTISGDSFNTHLPIISIFTGGQVIPGEARDGSTILTDIKLYDNEYENNFLSDIPKIETLANIRYRGNSSLEFDKKGLLLKFVTDNGEENSLNVLGMGKHNEWILNGPYIDKTLIRNYMWYNISSEIMEYAPEVRFCELFIDNEYLGLYIICESISQGESRVNINRFKENDIIPSYIIRLDRGSSNPLENLNNFTKYTRNIGETLLIDIKYPGNKYISEYTNEIINEDLSKFEKSLYSFDYKEYEKYIDVDSFVDYFIINEFTQNYDAGNLSTYLYKDKRGKLKLVIWDCNSVCNNYRKEFLTTTDFIMQNDVWFKMLIKDPRFVEKVIVRYRELRKSYLNEDYLLTYTDEVHQYLGDAKDRNFEKWGYTFLPEYDMMPDGKKVASFEQAVNEYKDFIIRRGRWLDENIEQLYQFSHPSVNKKYNH